MQLSTRDAAALASLLPEELALCYIMLKVCFPAAWLIGDGGGLLDYIGRRWFAGAVRQ